jgi:hypothetical protein
VRKQPATAAPVKKTQEESHDNATRDVNRAGNAQLQRRMPVRAATPRKG